MTPDCVFSRVGDVMGVWPLKYPVTTVLKDFHGKIFEEAGFTYLYDAVFASSFHPSLTWQLLLVRLNELTPHKSVCDIRYTTYCSFQLIVHVVGPTVSLWNFSLVSSNTDQLFLNCVNSDCDSVKLVVRHAVGCGGMTSPLGQSALFCGLHYKFDTVCLLDANLIVATWSGIVICLTCLQNYQLMFLC